MSKSHVPVRLRERVVAKARERCGYCLSQEEVMGTSLVIDHLIPEALGGATEEDNLWLSCAQCNLHKADRITARDPLTETWVPLFNPRRQAWDEHFQWLSGGIEMVGTTPIGRATVRALRLNRPVLMRSRRIWLLAGLHPPPE
jgi:hypothetical protein